MASSQYAWTASPGVVNVTCGSGYGSPIEESLASAGSIGAGYERVAPWDVVRFNPDLRRFERWHNYFGCWRDADRLTVRYAAMRLRFCDTWAEPIDTNDEDFVMGRSRKRA